MIVSNRLAKLYQGTAGTRTLCQDDILYTISSCIRGSATVLSHVLTGTSKEEKRLSLLDCRRFGTVHQSKGAPVFSSGQHTYDRLVDMPIEGISTLKDTVVYKDMWHAGVDIQGAVDAKKREFLGLYVDLPKEPKHAVREALPEFYHHPDLTKAKVHQFDYGCSGAMEEFASSGKHMCIYRECVDTVLQTVLGSAKGARLDILLDGWTGSGKSICLYALAAAAREKGWVVMYVPSASRLIRGGMFKKKDEDDSHWYTPLAASHILRGLYDSHSSILKTLPSIDGKTSLAEQCSLGLETGDDFLKVDMAVNVVQGLLDADGANDIRTLVIVDEYNYLYHRTEYHETMHRFHRRRIDPGELKLASAFRLLQGDRKAGIVAAAPTYSGPISPKTTLPVASSSNLIRIPRFSMEEVSNMASMLVSEKKIPILPPDASLKRALALTNGNGKELRQYRATMFSVDNGLRNSMPPSHDRF